MGANDFEQEEAKAREHWDVLSKLPFPLVVLNEDFSILYANRAFQTTFGIETGPAGTGAFQKLLPWDRFLDKIRGARLRWGIEDLEYRIKILSGAQASEEFTESSFELEMNRRLHRITLTPIRGLTDKTKLKTLILIEDLRPSDLPLESGISRVSSNISVGPSQWQLNEVPVALWEAHPATLAFTSVSPGVEALLGYSAAHWTEAAGFFESRIHPQDRAEVMAFYSAAIERGGDATAEFRAITASDRVVWCRETIRTLYTRANSDELPENRGLVPSDQPGLPPPGQPHSIVGVITDISLRKRLEEQMLRAERTQAFQVMANRMAHDLNNPLMIIAGYGEEVREALPPDHSLRADVDEILSAAQRISRFSSRLLELGDGKAKAPQLVDVVRVIAGIEGRIAATAGESVEIDLQLGEPAWGVAEPNQLEEMIFAIAAHGRDDKGTYLRLAITCKSEIISEHIPGATLSAGVYTCITIRREGVPLGDVARALIFEPFAGEEFGKTESQRALSRGYDVVRAWGGDIGLASDPLGSSFTIYLRRYTPELRESEAVEKTETPPNLDVARPRGVEVERKTILVVDDEPFIRALILKILRRERYFILEAASAEEALIVASKHLEPIHLLITDVILPGLSGRQLAEMMFSGSPKLKVIYISGYTDDESVRRGSIPPASRYLQKPFTLESLMGLVRSILED